MDANHLSQFSEWFDVLAVTHSKSFPSEEIRARAKAEYFDVLRAYPIEAVQSSYESLRRKMKKWPVPADWLEALPPFGSTGRLPMLTPQELALNAEAERLGYEAAAVCGCPVCREAYCAQPPRYVPQLDRDGCVIERRHPDKIGRAVLLGRWIHGQELRRWYSARAEFYALQAKLEAEDKAVKKLTPEQRMQRLVLVSKGVLAETKA